MIKIEILNLNFINHKVLKDLDHKIKLFHIKVKKILIQKFNLKNNKKKKERRKLYY